MKLPQAHLLPDGLVDAGDGGAHGVAVVVELADGIGEGHAVQLDGHGLAAGDVVPVEHGPTFFFGGGPFGSGAVDEGGEVGVVGVGVGDDF